MGFSTPERKPIREVQRLLSTHRRGLITGQELVAAGHRVASGVIGCSARTPFCGAGHSAGGRPRSRFTSARSRRRPT